MCPLLFIRGQSERGVRGNHFHIAGDTILLDYFHCNQLFVLAVQKLHNAHKPMLLYALHQNPK